MKKPAAAASGKGNLPNAKSAAAESKTAGQGPAKKQGKGKGKGKLSKDKSASQKGQGKEEKQQAEGSQGKNPKRKFPPCLVTAASRRTMLLACTSEPGHGQSTKASRSSTW